MSIYDFLQCNGGAGNSGPLECSDTVAEGLKKLMEYPAEHIPSGEYSLSDDCLDIDADDFSVRFDLTDYFSALCSMTAEDIPDGQYSEVEMPPAMSTLLCNCQPDSIPTGHYRESEDAPVPNLIAGRAPQKSPASLPDISNGLGKRQEARDIVALEKFASKSADWMVLDNCLYIYRGPCWIKLQNEKSAVREIRRVFWQHESICESLTPHDYKNIYNGLLSDPSLEVSGPLNTPEHCINCRDGVLNLLTMECRPNRPSDHYLYFFDLSCYTIQAPPCYGDFFESFANQVGDGNSDVRRQLLELLALAMTGRQLKVFYAMLGPSNCGKSQIGRFMEELLGRKNVMVVRHIDDFAGSFTVGSLSDKLLGMCLDLPAGVLPPSAIAILKQLVGDDPIKGERKYNDPFMFDKKPLLLLAGNHPIRVNQIDREDAFYNRLITIPFANPVKNMSDAVVDLYKHFLEEAPYIVHEACLAYQDLANRNWVPTRVPVPDEYAPQEGNQSILAVKAFVKECILSKGDSQVSTADLYQAYMDYALEESFPQISSATFSRTLSTVLNQVIPEAVQIKRVNGKEARGYSNIALI